MEKGGGGKGGGVGGGGKTSLKSIPASLGGKDDNSAKSKRGRKVQFNTEGLSEGKFTFSSKSDGKFETTYGKGGLTKGGKGDKVANGAKVSVVKEALPLELRVEQELPKNAKCLMDCEAAHILEGIQEQMALLSADPTIKIPVSFDKGLLSLSEHGVTDGEICVIANICPETVEEAYAIVPSLKDTLLFGTWKMRRTSFSLPERALAKWMGHCSKSNVLMLSTGLPFHSRLVMSSMAFMDYEILLIKELINVYCC
ncbi:DNA-directed RNA polymerases IV and V subunit 4 [Citrus sinensis]|uniref:DNA-directed RNA polymerases IV and V subunit 4 n=1 Tax=Citrus sinensis TaxID=2711 RepID=A0ACB8NKI2_CITSI|nr:DNA-directed RNA polymerases IV and V subunit 4 [Citrus sinensis]KAH9798354.1 DNA-directed RNA polymerases IV and V subunit 4 [Citrus sinensis]